MTPRPGWAREAEARIAGEQDSGGVLTAWVEVIENPGTEGTLNAGQARELAAALVQAADELDRLTGEAPPFV